MLRKKLTNSIRRSLERQSWLSSFTILFCSVWNSSQCYKFNHHVLGKYIYKDTLARNLAAVIYRDEKEIQKTALKQHRVLRTATEFRYGYKLVVRVGSCEVPLDSFIFTEPSELH